jgi:N-acetylneuraminate synthase
VLGSIALGARVIEKHFTDDIKRKGPDHPFSIDPVTWREMVTRTRELEYALGNGDKKIEENEIETVIVQRRCLRAAKNLEVGTILLRDMIEVLRPAPSEAIYPYDLERVIGRRLRYKVHEGEYFTWDKLE